MKQNKYTLEVNKKRISLTKEVFKTYYLCGNIILMCKRLSVSRYSENLKILISKKL
jgi:hypothetical protein